MTKRLPRSIGHIRVEHDQLGLVDRAKLPPRPQPIEIRTRERLYELHKDAHEITLEKRAVPAMGEELILSVNGRWRRMRVFRSGRSPFVDEAIAATESWLAQSGWVRR
jgi:hypothetical protein